MIRYLICAILSAVILLGSSNLYSQTTSATVDLSFIIDDTNLEEESDSELPTFSDPKDRDKYAPADPCLEYILSTTNIIRDTTINGNSNVRAIYQGHFLGCNYDSITYTQDWYRVSEYGFGNGPDWNPTYYNSSQTVIRHAGCTYEYDTITTEQNWISRRVNTSVYFDNATVIDCDTIYEDLTFNCDTIKSIQYTKDPNADAITVYINAKVSLDAITTERPLETLTHIPTQLNAEWYSITVPNCEKFEMNIPLPDGSTCGPIFIYSPCEHFPEEEPEILADCDDFDYSIAASSDIVIIRSNSESDSNYCAINWSFPDTITDSDIVIRTENELFDIDYSILGLNGVFVAEDSSNVTIDFFYEANGEEYFCSKELFVTCPDSTATIDSSELDKFIDCSLIQVNTQGSYCYKNEIVGCKLQWTVPEDYNPIVQIVGNNPKNISSNEGEVFIDGDGVNVLMTISYFDEEFGNGWITRTCDLGHFYCDNTTDSDGDGVTDDIDNCIYTANPNQYDNDQDGIGDACELDLDGDGVLDDNDNNIYAANPLQEDLNGDGIGDIGSDGIDSDGDGIPNHLDNCIYTPNPDQEDLNGDGIGNVCEKDTDGDGVLDDVDNCIGLHNPDQIDRNEDGVGDACQSENSCTPIILQKDNLCAVFNSIQFLEVGTTLDNVLLAGPDNIDQALETSNLSKEDYLLNLSVVNSVKVSYIIKLINSGEYSNIIPIFEKISYTDLNKFKFEEWGEYIEIPDDHVGQGFYTVEIEDINGTTISCSTLPFNIDTEVIEVDPEIEINLPTLECGVDPNNPTNMITDPQTELYVGNIVFMNGFPITISDITSSNSSSTGHYTGSGIMPLPFGNQKYVLLTLANIQVNRNNVIISGTVEEKANTTVLNNLLGVNVSTTWVVGDNYCVPPENVPSSTTSTNSSTNNNGTGGTNPGTFGPGGTHSGTGTNYDWNGYDSNGIHYATQDTINEFGCTQDGYNIHTQQYDCDPGQPYTEIDEYITSIGPALAITVDSSLQALFDSLELKIGNLSCDSLRTVMGTTMSQIKSNQNFNDTPLFDDLVKGEQSEYFNENLSEAFASPLTKPLVNQEQGPLIKTLENNHFDLYQCGHIH